MLRSGLGACQMVCLVWRWLLKKKKLQNICNYCNFVYHRISATVFQFGVKLSYKDENLKVLHISATILKRLSVNIVFHIQRFMQKINLR